MRYFHLELKINKYKFFHKIYENKYFFFHDFLRIFCIFFIKEGF
jgi:hypothetical protein